MKKIILAVLFTFMIIIPNQVMAETDIFGNEEVYLIAKGNFVKDSNAFIENNRTFVPLRKIAEIYGSSVDYNYEDKSITIKNEKDTLTMKLGSKNYTLNNEKKVMDVVPIVIDGQTFVPIRHISENFNKEVKWDGANKVVYIGDGWSFISTENMVEIPFQELGFKIYLPKGYENKVSYKVVNESWGSSLNFYNKNIAEKKNSTYDGFIAEYLVSDNPFSSQVTDSSLYDFIDGLYYCKIEPSDPRYDLKNKQDEKNWFESAEMLESAFIVPINKEKKEQSNEEAKNVFVFGNPKIKVTLPKDYEKDVVAVLVDGQLEVYDKLNKDAGHDGFLFSILQYDKDGPMEGETKFYNEQNNKVTALVGPTDVRFGIGEAYQKSWDKNFKQYSENIVVEME